MLQVFASGEGFAGTDEYASLNSDDSLVPLGLPEACLSSSPATALGQGSAGADLEWNPDQHSCEATFSAHAEPGKAAAEHLRVDADLAHAGFLILKLRRYPAWQVRVNGKTAPSFPARADGLITVPVGPGVNRVSADWIATRDVVQSRWLSLLALLALLAVYLGERRLSPPRLSSEECRRT